MVKFSARRDGSVPINFDGLLLGPGLSWAAGGIFAVSINIYRTCEGDYVVSVHRWAPWAQYDSRPASMSSAAIRATPREIVEWMLDEEGGEPTPGGIEALSTAAAVDTGFAAVLGLYKDSTKTKTESESGERGSNE